MLPDNNLLSLVIAQVGVGGVGGFALGVLLRRVTSLIIGTISFLFVTALVLLGGLTKLGVQIVKPETTERFFASAIETTLRGLLSASATALPFGGSFSLGLSLGLLVGKPQSWI